MIMFPSITQPNHSFFKFIARKVSEQFKLDLELDIVIHKKMQQTHSE